MPERRKIYAILMIPLLTSSIGLGLFSPLQNSVSAQSQDELKRQLEEIEKQIAAQEKDLRSVQGERQTLTNRLNQLKAEQNKLRLQIQATNLQVNQLGQQINQTKQNITTTEQKIAELRAKLADAVRAVHEQDQHSLIEMLATSSSLSEALDEVKILTDLSHGLSEIASEMTGLKQQLSQKQNELEEQHDETKNLLSIQYLQENEFGSKVKEQDVILKETQGKEAQYQAMLAKARREAASIRTRIYELAGGGPQTNVTFEEAIELAKNASALTGVRAALLLAVLTQESNLGKNVGTCNRPGDPAEKGWRVIMHPTRDQPKFLQITEELGLDPEVTPLSCPMRNKTTGAQIGWGGAMGPAQFIPSTWMGYKDKVTALTGRPANPWDIRDAFVAAAILLKNNGATSEGETGEWKAAMRYFSGGTNLAYRFYGDQVLAKARQYQAEIDALN